MIVAAIRRETSERAGAAMNSFDFCGLPRYRVLWMSFSLPYG